MTENTTEKTVKLNRLGLALSAYKGGNSTLCSGCGHDSITSQLVKAFWELDYEAHQVAKMSGIGCSSKTTAYFLNQAHGFNSVHGRMPAITTGTYLANSQLKCIGVSGDGDTASIGFSHFLHTVRRDVPMVYMIENNGVYGLTKGQFSATADKGSKHRGGTVNDSEPIDCCALAIQMGCKFVARSFSGDFKQLLSLLKAAMSHRGTAVLDIISPCITFNNHEGSTKSLKYARTNEDPLHELGFVPKFEEIEVEYDEGAEQRIRLPDGATLVLNKLDHDYDPGNRDLALSLLREASVERKFLTGLLYHEPGAEGLGDHLNLVETPLAKLPEEVIRPSAKVLDEINTRLG